MASLFEELDAKVKREPRLTKVNMARVDLSLLLFNARDDVRALWLAADQELARTRQQGRTVDDALEKAVDKLRPIFGQR